MQRNGPGTIDNDQPGIDGTCPGEPLGATSPHTEFRVLGNLEAYDDGKPISLCPRLRFLLAILLIHRQKTVSNDFLIDALWPTSPPSNARALLHVRISELRRALNSGTRTSDSGIATHTSGYKLQVNPEQVDCDQFEQLAVEARAALVRGDHAKAYVMVGDALDLWRGGPFQEFEGQMFAESQIAHLTSLYLQAQEDRFTAALAMGNHAEVLTGAPQLVAEYPLREGIWHSLILAQYRVGRAGEALTTYRTVNDLLSESLGIDPSKELQQLYVQVLKQDPVLDLPAGPENTRVRPNLPAPITPFIGRRQELDEIQTMIGEHRLVTLLGSGGTGKSRLAIEVAREAAPSFPGGVWFAELPPRLHAEIAIQTLAKSLGLSEHPSLPLEQVVEDFILRDKILIVLDNCEHLVDEVADLTQRLLQACPQLSILVTTQERLGVPGEALRVVKGMAVAGLDAADPCSMMQSDAVRLLFERASAVRPGFSLNTTNMNSVAQICRRLDGLPLAIELAAALVDVMDLSQIADRLDDRFELLQRSMRDPQPRHQTLRAAVDWSYGLLTSPEQCLFQRIAIFVGGFSLEAAEEVCSQPGENSHTVIATLARLVDKSFVLSEEGPGGGRRYKLLDSLRIFGLEKLRSNGDLQRLRDRHTSYYAAVAEEAAEWLNRSEQERWLHLLEVEHDNVRAALDWSIGAENYDTAARMAGSLYRFWDLRGHYAEGRRWLGAILQPHITVTPESRTKLLLGVATLAVIQGDLGNAAIACEEAASLARQTGSGASLAYALQYLGLSQMYSGNYASAEAALGESLENAIDVEDLWLESWAYVFLAAVALSRGQHGRARRLGNQFLATPDSHYDAEAVGWINLIIGATEWYDGEFSASIPWLGRGFGIFMNLGGLWGLSVSIFLLSQLAGARGDTAQQVVLMSAGEHLRNSIGVGLFPFMLNWLNDASTDCIRKLGQKAFAQEWQEGESLPLEVVFALSDRELTLASRSMALPAHGSAISLVNAQFGPGSLSA